MPMSEPKQTERVHGLHGARRPARAARFRAAPWAIAAVIVMTAGWMAFRNSPAASPPGTTAGSTAVQGLAGCASGRSIHVAPDGVAGNDGTPERPLPLAAALLRSGPARPCDTIWLTGGTYRGAFVSELEGREGAPIIVRQAPGERAAIDGAGSNEAALQARGAWTWFMDFEVTNTDPLRVSVEAGAWPGDLRRGTGVHAAGSHLKFINLVVHDVTRGFEIGSSSLDTEVYGTLIYYNGWEGPNGTANGHGIDTHNRVGVRRLADNIVFSQFSHGIIAYASAEDPTDNIVLEGNVIFNNGVLSARHAGGRELLIGGGAVAHKPTLRGNVTFGDAPLLLGLGSGCEGGVIEDNYFANGSVDVANCQATIRNNVFARPAPAVAQSHPENKYIGDKPVGVEVKVRPNQYVPGRANIVILNWDALDEVEVDLRGLGLQPGAAYDLRDAQNFFGDPVVRGMRGAASVKVPMTMTDTATPVGTHDRGPAHTAPQFAALVLVPVQQRLSPSTR
jgi:hypothetical protein